MQVKKLSEDIEIAMAVIFHELGLDKVPKEDSIYQAWEKLYKSLETASRRTI